MTRCTVDANRDPIGCRDAGTLSAAIDWTGAGTDSTSHGLIRRSEVVASRSTTVQGVERAASATVALGGTAVDPSAMQFAGFGIRDGGVITICPHG